MINGVYEVEINSMNDLMIAKNSKLYNPSQYTILMFKFIMHCHRRWYNSVQSDHGITVINRAFSHGSLRSCAMAKAVKVYKKEMC